MTKLIISENVGGSSRPAFDGPGLNKCSHHWSIVDYLQTLSVIFVKI